MRSVTLSMSRVLPFPMLSSQEEEDVREGAENCVPSIWVRAVCCKKPKQNHNIYFDLTSCVFLEKGKQPQQPSSPQLASRGRWHSAHATNRPQMFGAWLEGEEPRDKVVSWVRWVEEIRYHI